MNNEGDRQKDGKKAHKWQESGSLTAKAHTKEARENRGSSLV